VFPQKLVQLLVPVSTEAGADPPIRRIVDIVTVVGAILKVRA
jgi:hypothetical protein